MFGVSRQRTMFSKLRLRIAVAALSLNTTQLTGIDKVEQYNLSLDVWGFQANEAQTTKKLYKLKELDRIRRMAA